ncbi:DUF732 domain-containing protein [Mycolicibacterium chubuense]|nr:DUF732 domain-containing protein [Mycolicibacterium chubuense]
MVAAPASADDQGFLDAMDELGISSYHGHVGDNATEDRSNLVAGQNICNNLHTGYSVLDEQRMLLINSHTRHAMDQDPITPAQVSGMVDAARRFLCPDTL